MEDKQFKSLMKVLSDIDNKLALLVNLEKSKSKAPKLGNKEKIILKLCNGKNTVADIQKSTSKTKKSIQLVIARLKKKGVIKSTTSNKKTTYVKL